MSQGKYSPNLPTAHYPDDMFIYNADKQIPMEWDPKTMGEYSERSMFGHYDEDGFDRYGYSAFDSNGTYVGIGRGVDRNGVTEMEYLSMSPEEFENY